MKKTIFALKEEIKKMSEIQKKLKILRKTVYRHPKHDEYFAELGVQGNGAATQCVYNSYYISILISLMNELKGNPIRHYRDWVDGKSPSCTWVKRINEKLGIEIERQQAILQIA